jgi:hypothetical protein
MSSELQIRKFGAAFNQNQHLKARNRGLSHYNFAEPLQIEIK